MMSHHDQQTNSSLTHNPFGRGCCEKMTVRELHSNSSHRETAPAPPQHCGHSIHRAIDAAISTFFKWIGGIVGTNPKLVLTASLLLAMVCSLGLTQVTTESRLEELWIPQDTPADEEEALYLQYFDPNVRLNQIIFSSPSSNVLTKEQLLEAMDVHEQIAMGRFQWNESSRSTINETSSTFGFSDLCIRAWGSCETILISNDPTSVCNCFINSILGQWNYNRTTLEQDEDWWTTLQKYGSGVDDLKGVLGKPEFDGDNGTTLLSAEAFVVNYLLVDRSYVENGAEVDPINSGWEESVFLNAITEHTNNQNSSLQLDYFAGRSFDDVFNGTIFGDLYLVQISFMAVFLFLGAALGKRATCGKDSRWTLSQAGVCLVGLSVAASFGVASVAGLFYGPVHSLLPFVLLGIGVDDAFVIVNAFHREQANDRCRRSSDIATDQDIADRCRRGLARAGASITVTSATDLVAFAISSTSALPALASFCAYASIGIFFLWFFSVTFFTAALVLDERRQRDNRMEIFFCFRRSENLKDDNGNQEERFQEGHLSNYFRRFHAPLILSTCGKFLVFLVFSGLLGLGVFGATQLSVEDSYRSFIPADNYIRGWLDAGDEFFATRGNEVNFVFRGQEEIFNARNELAHLSERLSNHSISAPYFADPSADDVFRNVMAGFKNYLVGIDSSSTQGLRLGADGWPADSNDFAIALSQFATFIGAGPVFALDVSFSANGTLNAIRIKTEYVRLVKQQRGEQIEDAEKLIAAMDTTRALIASWTDLPPASVYGEQHNPFVTMLPLILVSSSIGFPQVAMTFW